MLTDSRHKTLSASQVWQQHAGLFVKGLHMGIKQVQISQDTEQNLQC